LDDGSSLVDRQEADLGEGMDEESQVSGEMDAADSLLRLKDALDRMASLGPIADEPPKGDLGESENAEGAEIDKLLGATCGGTASKGYYDSSTCGTSKSVLTQLIAHLKQREKAGHPLTFKEYGKLETFYAIQSMAELTRIHAMKHRLNQKARHELFQQETKVLDALHDETEAANKVQADAHSSAKLATPGAARHEIAQGASVAISQQRLSRQQTAEANALKAAQRKRQEDNKLLYKKWGDKGVLGAELHAEKQGEPEKFSTVKNEKMQASKMIVPMIRTFIPNIDKK